MNKLTTLALLAAGLIAAGSASASACSYGGMDFAVDGKGNVVEILEDGHGSQITGRIFGKYSKLQAQIEGNCHVLVVDQQGNGTNVDVGIDGWIHKVGVMAADGAEVNVNTSDYGSQILILSEGGDVNVDNNGPNKYFIQTR